MTGEQEATLREEVLMDNAAPTYFGKKPYPDLHVEVHRRAKAALAEDAESAGVGRRPANRCSSFERVARSDYKSRREKLLRDR
jgi:hypothetical protein